jgi:hypothetical protein
MPWLAPVINTDFPVNSFLIIGFVSMVILKKRKGAGAFFLLRSWSTA